MWKCAFRCLWATAEAAPAPAAPAPAAAAAAPAPTAAAGSSTVSVESEGAAAEGWHADDGKEDDEEVEEEEEEEDDDDADVSLFPDTTRPDASKPNRPSSPSFARFLDSRESIRFAQNCAVSMNGDSGSSRRAAR